MNEDNAPQTIKEVGIHLLYMKKDMSVMKDLMETFPSSFASIKDMAALQSRVSGIEKRNGAKSTLVWVCLVASALLNLFAVFQLFTRG